MRSARASPGTLILRVMLSLLLAGHGIPVSAWASAPIQMRIVPLSAMSPDAITSIQAEPDFSAPKEVGKIKLNWSAPKDGSGQQVFSYLIRYATFSVVDLGGNTAMWWNHPNTFTALDGELPSRWGRKSQAAVSSIETVIITGLTPGKYYYIGVKSVDRYFRKSAWDNLFKGLTTQASAYATTPPWEPHVITTLAALPIAELKASALLTWQAPYFIDDKPPHHLVPGHIMQPGEYCIQFSTVAPPMTLNRPNQPNNWAASHRHFISTRNVRTGDLQSHILTGLSQNTTYYIHIFTRNEWPNKWSSESFPVTRVRPYILLKPVENLMALAGGSANENIGSYVTLSWQNPSDEQFFRGVRIAYSTTTYPTSPNEPNFIDVEPLFSGGATNFVHVRLLPRTTYYYSVWAYDTNILYSSATRVSVYTGVDLLAPSAVLNITPFISLDRTGDLDRFNINMSWTKPTEPLHRNIDFGGVRIYYSAVTPNALHHRFSTTTTNTSFSHNDLKPYTTYYYSFASFDTSGNEQPASERAVHLVYISGKYVPPSPPVLLASVYSANREYAEGCKLSLTWMAPNEAYVERIVIRMGYDDFPRDISEGEKLLERAMRPGEESSGEFNRLLSLTTHYVSLFAVSRHGLASRPRKLSFYSYIPWSDSVAPLTPLDIRMFGRTRFTWGPVKFDAERKAIPRWSTPDISDIYFYEIYTSTAINAGWQLMARLAPSATSFNLPVSSGVKYYKCRAVDASWNYADSYVLDTDGNVFVMTPDKSYVMIPPGAISKTRDPQDSSRDKYLVALNRNHEQERGSVYKSLNVDISRIEVTSTTLNLEKIPNFNFGTSKCQIAFSYEVSGDRVRFGAMALEQNELQNSLGVFYFDGIEWTRINTVVAADENYVRANIRRAGTYHLRHSPTTGEFVFYDVVPKIITPNNDGLNDRALFRFANPRADKVSLKIYDINSALVKNICETTCTSDAQGEHIFWDGTDKDGKTVQPGVYIYQLEVGGKIINGTIVVAR